MICAKCGEDSVVGVRLYEIDEKGTMTEECGDEYRCCECEAVWDSWGDFCETVMADVPSALVEYVTNHQSDGLSSLEEATGLDESTINLILYDAPAQASR